MSKFKVKGRKPCKKCGELIFNRQKNAVYCLECFRPERNYEPIQEIKKYPKVYQPKVYMPQAANNIGKLRNNLKVKIVNENVKSI